MKWIRCAVAILALLLAGCETTGNPRQGGLFGWSETKARERQAERREQIAAAEGRVQGEHQRGAQLRSRNAAATRQLTSAEAETRHTNAKVREREAALVARVRQLETASPTAATASRARSLRMRVDELIADRTFSPVARARELRELEAEIDAAFANVDR